MHDGRRINGTAAVIVAAGAATRFGRPKQLATLGSETLLERTVRVAREAGCSPIVVVLGASAEQIRAGTDLSACEVVLNPAWRSGMGSSIALGVQHIKGAAGVVVLTCDMPSVQSGHLRALLAAGDLTASYYSARNGVPAFFPSPLFPQLMRLRGDTGARDLLQTARAVDLPDGDLDIDTELDLRRARDLLT